MREAVNYANQKKNELQNYLNQMLQQQQQAYANQQQALDLQKQNTMNQINAQTPIIEQNALQNSREAFVNKMLGNKSVNQQLAQAGLSTTGAVGTAQANVENQYSQNLGNIQLAKQNQLRDLENQKLNVNNEYAQRLLELQGRQNADKLNMIKYGAESQRNAYNDAYAQYMDNLRRQDAIKQQEYINNFNNRKYQDALRQQAIENELNNKKYQQSLVQYQNALKQQAFENDLATKRYNNSVNSTNTSNVNNIDNIDNITTYNKPKTNGETGALAGLNISSEKGRKWWTNVHNNMLQGGKRQPQDWEWKIYIKTGINNGWITEDEAVQILKKYNKLK